jgi:hypothetical protein
MGVEHVLDHLLRDPAHARECRRHGDRGELGQGDGALGDVLGVVRHALEVRGDAQAADDEAQVGGDGLAQREQADDLGVDIAALICDSTTPPMRTSVSFSLRSCSS